MTKAAGPAAAVALGALVLNTAAAHPQLSTEATYLQNTLSDLSQRSSFGNVQADIIELDSNLSHALNLLESAREKDFYYQKDLDEIAHQAASQWQLIRDRLEATLHQEAQVFQNRLNPLNQSVQRLNANLGNPTAASPLLRDTQTVANNLLGDIQTIQARLQNEYNQIKSQVFELNRRLTQIHWALNQFAEAQISSDRGEDLVMAVRARWDQSGDHDPEGVLFLTNKRFLFERKEKEATKKVLFITVASELVQEVLIDQPIQDIKKVKAANKGLFGHQDFLEVDFKAANLDKIAFHLDGQESKDWAILVERVRSGKIEEERSTGSGLSLGELVGPLTQASIIALQNEVNDLQDEMMLKDVRQDLEALENDARELERVIGELRAQGYAIEKNLEADVAILTTQWERVKSNAEKTLDHQTGLLGERMGGIQQDLAALVGMSSNLSEARPRFLEIKSAIASSEAQADAAEDTVLAQYEDYAEEVETLNAHFDWVDWMLDAIATASFQLLATESGVAATEALWMRPNAEPENGILLLTDQRLIWEDRVGDYEMKVNVPLQQVEDVSKELDESGEREVLRFTFMGGAPLVNTRFELSSPVAETWLEMVGRARAGGYVIDRAVELSQEEIEKVRNAPDRCANCGAPFTAPILRGQGEIHCEFCSVVTRL
jgi:hypothetical protein